MNFSFYIARRLSLASGDRKGAPAVKVSVAAVALCVAVMLAAISIVLGFKREIREKVVGFNSHITIYSAQADSGNTEDNLMTLTSSLENLLQTLPFVTDYSLEASIPAVMKTPDDFKGIYLRSLNGTHTTEFISSNLEEGAIPDYSKEGNQEKVVISRVAANSLGLKLGDKVDTYFISDNVRVRRVEVAGIFNSHFDNYDGVIMYGALPLIQKLGAIGARQGTNIQVQTDDFDRIDEYTEAIRNALTAALVEGRVYKVYRVENARAQGAGYFSWLSLLDTNVTVILTLMTIVAVATLISGMLILILDKKRLIGILRAMGLSEKRVRSVFIYLAIRIGLIGMLIGNGFMLLLLYIQQRWHLLPLDAEAYYIDFVPVELSWIGVILLNAGVIAILYLCLVLPSRFAAKISPAESMRTDDYS